ncbi:MAG: hypothetical protein JWO40_317 [Candidatus Doudnabacteria bacterium]|nr:hypothetical protein [Candidatus Doudnabacteria bacterium]
MKSIRELLAEDDLKKLASRSNFRYGQEIAKNDAIKIKKSNTFNLIVEIKPFGQRQIDTELHSTTKGLRWKCSCTAKKNFFCEHCVAVGLYLNTPAQRSE